MLHSAVFCATCLATSLRAIASNYKQIFSSVLSLETSQNKPIRIVGAPMHLTNAKYRPRWHCRLKAASTDIVLDNSGPQ